MQYWFVDLVEWLRSVQYGADPIEALHGHRCGPKCWHWEALSEAERKVLMQAPWNH